MQSPPPPREITFSQQPPPPLLRQPATLYGKRKIQKQSSSSSTPLFTSQKINNCVWTIPSKYEILRLLGKGSFGMVCAVRDNESGQVYAVKRIHQAFKNVRSARAIWSELRAMTWFKHPNLLSLCRIDPPLTVHSKWNAVYVYMPMMVTDAFHQFGQIKEKKAPPYEMFHIREWMVHLLSALDHMHKAGIMHRDMSSTNVMFEEKTGRLKLGDFGIIRNMTGPSPRVGGGGPLHHTTDQGPKPLTEYIAQYYYRAPEILLREGNYNEKIDCWAVGAIFGEWLLGTSKDYSAIEPFQKPLFMVDDEKFKTTQPPIRYIMQLAQIFKWIDRPAANDLKKICDEHIFQAFLDMNILKGMECRPASQPLNQVFSFAGKEAVDLLTKLLTLDPNQRISASDALKHSFLKDVPIPVADESSAKGSFDLHSEEEWNRSKSKQWKQWICSDFAEYIK